MDAIINCWQCALEVPLTMEELLEIDGMPAHMEVDSHRLYPRECAGFGVVTLLVDSHLLGMSARSQFAI